MKNGWAFPTPVPETGVVVVAPRWRAPCGLTGFCKEVWDEMTLDDTFPTMLDGFITRAAYSSAIRSVNAAISNAAPFEGFVPPYLDDICSALQEVAEGFPETRWDVHVHMIRIRAQGEGVFYEKRLHHIEVSVPKHARQMMVKQPQKLDASGNTVGFSVSHEDLVVTHFE